MAKKPLKVGAGSAKSTSTKAVAKSAKKAARIVVQLSYEIPAHMSQPLSLEDQKAQLKNAAHVWAGYVHDLKLDDVSFTY